jgi:hypothetical protein
MRLAFDGPKSEYRVVPLNVFWEIPVQYTQFAFWQAIIFACENGAGDRHLLVVHLACGRGGEAVLVANRSSEIRLLSATGQWE